MITPLKTKPVEVNSQDGIEVSYAHLHAPIFIPGAGNYKETLTADLVGPDRNMKMYLKDTHLLLLTKNVKVAIPLANVTHMVIK
jgi:hypothetical protein